MSSKVTLFNISLFFLNRLLITENTVGCGGLFDTLYVKSTEKDSEAE